MSGHEGSPHSLQPSVSRLLQVRSSGRLSVPRLLGDGSQGREDSASLGLALTSDLPAGRRVGVVAPILEAGDLPGAHQLVPGGGAVVGHHRPEHRGVGGEGEPAVSDLTRLLAVDWFTARRRSVPSLVDVTHEVRPAHQDVARLTLVADHRLELAGSVEERQATVGDVGWHPALQVWGGELLETELLSSDFSTGGRDQIRDSSEDTMI